jgi:uridine kinase
MEQLFERIKDLLARNPSAVIGIDGRCASGKTTLAQEIVARFNAQIIHMDDFFLPFEMRTDKRLSETGGNVHYERFNAEVVSGLEKGGKFAYRAFCCKNGTYGETKSVSADKPIVIEGSYAFHPEIKINYDLKIFLTSDYETRLERIRRRNGDEMLEIFKSKWIPLEEKYFSGFSIEEKCDIVKYT